MNYETDHYLYGKTDEQITTLAQSAIDIYGKPSGRDTDVYERSAAIHELKRLKAGVETTRLAESMTEAMTECIKITFEGIPPSDWLTRAIETAGAPEGSDWAGLLDVIEGTCKQRDEWMQVAHNVSKEIGGPRGALLSDIDGIVVMAQSIRKRADLAEGQNYELCIKIDRLDKRSTVLDDVVESLSMNDGDLLRSAPDEVRKLREERDKWHNLVKEAHSLAIPEDGPGLTLMDSIRKLRERAEALEVKNTELTYERTKAMALVIEHTGDYANSMTQAAKWLIDHNKELEATVERMKREQVCAESRLSELEDTTTPPLDRIAAALERLANAH